MLVNLTGKTLVYRDFSGVICTVVCDTRPFAYIAYRQTSALDPVNGLDVCGVAPKVANLPSPEEGVMLIVSEDVALYCRDRQDLVFPIISSKLSESTLLVDHLAKL